MKPSDYFKIGPRLTLAFALLIALILAGNLIVIWQFHLARVETDRLTNANRQLNAILQLQVGLLAFHQRMDDLARSGNAQHLTAEVDPLRRAFLDQINQTREAAARPSAASANPDLLPTLDTIEVALPGQLDAISGLAIAGDWESVQRRLDKELKPIETQTSVLVGRIQHQASRELTDSATRMAGVQRRIIVIVPIVAISTFCFAAFFGWAVARRIVELRLEERAGERTRIARELHDSLLQSLHGLMFEFQAARNMFQKRPGEALQALDNAIMGTEQAIVESQDAIADLRSTAMCEDDLPQLVRLTGENLVTVRAGEQKSPTFGLIVEGQQRVLTPAIRDEVYRIAREVLRNAFRHAQATKVQAEIRYGKDHLRLRVWDDGRGMDPRVMEMGIRPGHWGLPGVRERAHQIGAKLDVRSEEGAGTEVQLNVTASVAYRKDLSRSRSGAHKSGEHDCRT